MFHNRAYSVKNEYPVDQKKPTRTPVQTFLKLLKGRRFNEISYVLVRKTKTMLKLLYRYSYALPVKSLQRNTTLSQIIQHKHLKKTLASTYGYRPISENTNKIKIVIILGRAHSRPTSSAFIRLISPLTTGNNTARYAITFFEPDKIKLNSSYDLCIVQRAIFESDDSVNVFINQLDKNGIKLIIDSDDSFHNVDITHPEHHIHGGRVDAFSRLLARADEIWLSTSELAKSYGQYTKKIVIVPNTLDQRLWKLKTMHKNTEPSVRFLYMGTATHGEDFKLVLPAFEKLALKYPNRFSLHVIGVADDLPNLEWLKILPQAKGSMYPDFVEWFQEQGPFDYGLSPLVDSAFNRSKSDIKCLDYLAVGIVPVVSNVLPYQSKDIANFIIKVQNNDKGWFKTLDSLIINIDKDRRVNTKLITAATKYIIAERSSHVAAEQINSRIEKLVTRQALIKS